MIDCLRRETDGAKVEPLQGSKEMAKKQTIYPAVENPNAKAIVIYCIDLRYPIAFRLFVEKELGYKEGQVVHIEIAGGPAALAHPKDMKNRCRSMIRQILFSCEHFKSIERVILIGHQDCAYYSVVPRNGNGEKDREKKDLPIAVDLIGLIVPEKVVVQAYYAYFADKKRTKIAFQQIV